MLSPFLSLPAAPKRVPLPFVYTLGRGSKADLSKFFCIGLSVLPPAPPPYPSLPRIRGCLDSGNGVDVSDPRPLITRRCAVLAGQSPCPGPTPRPAGCRHRHRGGPARPKPVARSAFSSSAEAAGDPQAHLTWAGAYLPLHVGRHPRSSTAESCLKVRLDFSQILILSQRAWAEPSPPHPPTTSDSFHQAL